jgi:hypothetical protein
MNDDAKIFRKAHDEDFCGCINKGSILNREQK